MIYKKMQTDTSNENGKIVFYQIDDANIYVNVLYHKETFWMTTKAMAELFGINTQGITKHLLNIYEEEELEKKQLVPKWNKFKKKESEQ